MALQTKWHNMYFIIKTLMASLAVFYLAFRCSQYKHYGLKLTLALVLIGKPQSLKFFSP